MQQYIIACCLRKREARPVTDRMGGVGFGLKPQDLVLGG